jgi:hypothetical protein
MDKKNFSGNSSSLLKEQIDKFFNKEKKDTQALLYQISLLVFKFLAPDTDLYDLFKNEKIDSNTLDALINHYDGELIKFPTKKQWKECLLTTLCFYLKYVKNMSWSQIKKEIPMAEKDITSSLTISLGKKNKLFSKKIKAEFQDIINNLEDKDIMKMFHKLEGDE